MNKEIKIKDLVSDLETIENNSSLNIYKNLPYEKKISRCVEDNFKRITTVVRRRDSSYLKHSSLSNDILRNRKRAIIDTLPKVLEKYKDKYDAVCLEYEYINYNCSILYSNYDTINNQNFIFEAATLYILYNAAKYDEIDNLIELLPTDEGTIHKALVHPEARDLNFSDDIICSLVSLFQDFSNFNEKVDSQYILTKEYATKEVSSLKNYDILEKIFSMIPENELNKIVDDFKNDVDKIFNLVFEITNHYQKQISKLTSIQRKLVEECVSIDKNLSNIFLRDATSSMIIRQFECIEEFTTILQDEEELDDYKYYFIAALNTIYDDYSLLKEDSVEDFVMDKIKSLEIDNPFETCLAFAYLLFKKDDIIWLINPCLTLLKLAGEKLPWNKDFNTARINNEKEIEAIETRVKEINNFTDDDYLKFSYEFFDKYQNYNKSLFSQIYNDSWRWNNVKNANEGDLIKMNLPQLVFDYTSIVMPLDLFTFENENDPKFEQSGFKKEEINLLKLLMTTYNSVGFNYTLKKRDDEQEESINENDIESLRKSLTDKKSELKKLKTSYNELQKNNSRLKKENENHIDNIASLKNEIAQLRELVFNLQSDIFEDDDNTQENVKLPYIPNKKTIIIGGTDTWINKFKEKLDNVIFISSKTKINQDLLKTAEVIWIQTIALKHADFYSVSVYKEKRNIPLNYFSYSNINKCLKQLIDYDKNNH